MSNPYPIPRPAHTALRVSLVEGGGAFVAKAHFSGRLSAPAPNVLGATSTWAEIFLNG